MSTGDVRPAFSLSHKQVGMVRAYLSHHSEEPREPTLKALGVWPHWDTIVAELEEKMVRETILGLRRTLDEATAGHEAAVLELDDEELQELHPIVHAPPADSRSPGLSLYAMASLFATLVADPSEFEAECRKRNTTEEKLAEDAALWGILFECDPAFASQWEEEVAFALRYLTRNVRLDHLPAHEPAPAAAAPPPSAPRSAPEVAPAPPPVQPPAAGFQPPNSAPPVALPPMAPPSSPMPHGPDVSGIDGTAVGVQIDLDGEPLPFETGEFVPPPVSDASVDEQGETAFFNADDLMDSEAIPFEEAGEQPGVAAGAFSMRQYAGLCVERQLWPDQEAKILARYGINAEQAKAIDAHFRIRLADPNELEEYYVQAAAYQQWIEEQR